MNRILRDLLAAKTMPVGLDYFIPCHRAELADSLGKSSFVVITAQGDTVARLDIMQTENGRLSPVIDHLFGSFWT